MKQILNYLLIAASVPILLLCFCELSTGGTVPVEGIPFGNVKAFGVGLIFSLLLFAFRHNPWVKQHTEKTKESWDENTD